MHLNTVTGWGETEEERVEMWSKIDGLGQGGVMRRKETKSWIAWRLAVSSCSHEDYSSATVDLLSTTLSTALNKLNWNAHVKQTSTNKFWSLLHFKTICSHIYYPYFIPLMLFLCYSISLQNGSVAPGIRHSHDLSLVHPSAGRITPSQNSYSFPNEPSLNAFHLSPLSFLSLSTCRIDLMNMHLSSASQMPYSLH